MIKLYWSPRSRSFTALWLLEETGQPYERVLTDISTGAQKTPEFLAINPMGKVPALADGDIAIAESAAICAYVAEHFPDAKLAPPLGDPRRGKYLQWLFFGPSCIEPSLIQIFTKLEVPSSTAAWGNATQVFDVLDKALEKGPWILGDSFSAADIDGTAGKDVTFPIGPQQTMTLNGADYLVGFALPNFYFHATTAYDILRHCGVELGKRDFLGLN